MNVCFDLTFNDPAHLVRDRVAILDLAVDDPCGLLQSSQNGLTSVLSYAVPSHIKVRQSVIILCHEGRQALGTLVADHVSSQVQGVHHLSIF